MSTAKKMVNQADKAPNTFDPLKIREDFPVLHQKVKDKPLVYLDNAATAQKPTQVIEAVNRYYRNDNANIHRGIHMLSERATEEYETARVKIQKFINAKSEKEIIFVRGATEGINLIAQTFGRKNIKAGDEILISQMEHHANIVPWQMLCEQVGASLKIIPINQKGELLVESFEQLISEKTRLVAIVHVSNSLGTINPVKKLIEQSHAHNIPVLLDGAQAVAHQAVDVQNLNCDFYVFSGHKLFGPTGIGVLYGKESLLEAMPPYQGGGDMIRTVRFEKTTYNSLPYKFEAGTPHIAGVIGLGAAIDYLNKLDWKALHQYETELLEYANKNLEQIDGLRLIGTAANKVCVHSFILEGIHPHDIGTILDQEGVAIRTGHHCTMPLMEFFKIPATARASMSFYNTKAEVDLLVKAITKVKEVFG